MLCRRAATGTAARCRGLTSATCSDAVVQRRWGSTSAHGGTAAIERLPSSVPRRVFDTAAGSNHGSIVAESFGDERNEPIVFFHGGGQNRWTWERTAITMAEAGYFAVTVDMKGHGDSYWDPLSQYSSEFYGQDVSRLLSMTGLAPRCPHLVGASLGGLSILMSDVAATCAKTVTVVDITPRMEAVGVRRIVSFMHNTAQAGFDTLEDVAKAVAKYQSHRSSRSLDPERLKSLRKVVRPTPDGRWRWHWDPNFVMDKLMMADDSLDNAEVLQAYLDGRRDAYLARAKLFHMPCLVLCGRQSDLTAQDGVDELLATFSDGHFVSIDAHHMVAGDSNTVFCNEILRFLGQTTEPTHDTAPCDEAPCVPRSRL